MWLAVVLFVIILGLFAYLDTKKPKNYPPGPKWLPVIGSALTVLKGRKRTGNLYKATAEMAEQYGPVVGLKVGRDLVVVVYGKNALKEFLMCEDLNGRPTGAFFEMRTWGKRLGVMLTDSDLWQDQRRFVLRQLREFGFGRKNMSSMIQEEAGCMIEGLRNTINNNKQVEIDMESLFNIHVFNTLWTMLAGKRYSPEDKNLKSLQNILGKLFVQIDMIGAPFSQFPILKYIAPVISGYKPYVDTHSQLWEFLNFELKLHKDTFDENNLKDFMDVYLKVLNSPEKKTYFCEKQLLAICLDMFMAGSETTSKSLGFCFVYLLLYPDVQKKAQAEIDRVVGRDRLPSLDDRPNMPYMECVVLETLRVFSGRAFAIPHRAMKDTHLNGYFIPKDTMLIANLNGTLMGPESGALDPDTFNPERFIKDGKLTVDEAYIPFGFGKRRCLGESMARANLFLLTATLLQNFTFTVSPEHPPSLRSIDGITPSPTPYKALVSPRF